MATYPTAARVISYLKRMGMFEAPLVTVITDNTAHSQWVHPETDLYLVGSEKVRQALTYQGVPHSKILVTGIPIDLKFSRIMSPLTGPARQGGWEPAPDTVLQPLPA